MVRCLVAVLAVTVLGAPATVAGAATASHTLTVQGVPNAYTEVRFAGRVRLATSTNARPTFATTGTYAGVYLEPVRGDGPGAGTVLLRAMPGLSDVPIPIGSQSWLPAGSYRVHLLGDATTAVTVRLEGLARGLVVTTKTRSRVAATWVGRGVAGVTAPADRTIVPFTVHRRTLTLIAAGQESTGFYGQRDICVRERGTGLAPCLDGNAGHGRYWSVYPLRWTMGGAAVYRPGTLPLGELEVEFLDVTVATPHRMAAFVMSVD